MKSLFLVLAFTTLSLGSLTAGENPGSSKNPLPVAPEAATGSRFHFGISAGAAYRSIGDVRFSTGSQSGGLRLPFLAVASGGEERVPALVRRALTPTASIMTDL